MEIEFEVLRNGGIEESDCAGEVFLFRADAEIGVEF